MSLVPNDVLFNDSRYAKLREQWCAGVLGVGYRKRVGYCRVAVNDTRDRQDADFFLEAGEIAFPFQTVEAQDPDRRRGKEHRDIASGRIHSVPYEPDKRSVEGVGWICDKIAQKVAKRYSGAQLLSLLVYANFQCQRPQIRHRR
jgi:hypothetical protein